MLEIRNSNRLRAGVSGAAALAACLGTAAAVGTGSAAAATQASGAKSLVNVSYTGPSFTTGTDSALYYAEKHGYFKKLGINVTINPGISSPDTVDSVASGSSTFGESLTPSDIEGAVGGASVVGVAEVWGGSSYGFYVPKGTTGGIKALAGKSIISTAQAEPLVNAALKSDGVDPSSVTHVIVAGTALASTYFSGGGDALYSSLGLEQTLDAQKPSTLMYAASVGLDIPDDVIITTRKELSAHPGIVRAFTEGTLEGYQAIMKHPFAATSLITAADPALPAATASYEIVSFKQFLCSKGQKGKPYGYNLPSSWSASLYAVKAFGGITTTEPAKYFYTNQFFTGKNKLSVATC